MVLIMPVDLIPQVLGFGISFKMLLCLEMFSLSKKHFGATRLSADTLALLGSIVHAGPGFKEALKN